MDPVRLGKHLAQRARALSMSQRAIGAKVRELVAAGVLDDLAASSQQMVSFVLSGQRNATLRSVGGIACALGWRAEVVAGPEPVVEAALALVEDLGAEDQDLVAQVVDALRRDDQQALRVVLAASLGLARQAEPEAKRRTG